MADLYQIPVAAASGPVVGTVVAKLLANKCLVPRGDAANYEVHTDSRGRLLVLCQVEGGDLYGLFRVDFASGRRRTLEYGTYLYYPGYVQSPGRTRVLRDQDAYYVWELEGWSGFGPLNNVQEVTFLGEDIYLISQTYGPGLEPAALWRLTPNGQMELIDHHVKRAMTMDTDRGPRLLLKREAGTEDGVQAIRYSLFDPETRQDIRLPPTASAWRYYDRVSTSHDGHWLAFSTGKKLVLVNWVTSEVEEIDTATDGISDWEWRPQHNELWLGMKDGSLRIWKPGGDLVAMPTAPLQVYRASKKTRSVFTSDGRYWFSSRPADQPDAQPGLRVGLADAPEEATFEITPAGAGVNSLWELPQGKLLAGAWTTNYGRRDYYLVDPRTGARQEFVVHGVLVALGHTRMLAYVDLQIGPGTADLRLIDLATGAQTLMAENVLAAVADPGTYADVPPGTDALAPGTRVAYLVRNRLESPYDGLWVTELP